MAEVRLEVDLAHPPDRVWQALTTAPLLGAWFMPTDLEPREASRFTLDPGTLAGFLGLVSGELVEVVPEHKLVMLWQGEKLHTRVVWELVGTAGGCRVQVVQTGFIGAPAALRRRALRDTYVRLFAEQLPALLDRLASGTGALAAPVGAAPPGLPPPDLPLRAAAPPDVVRAAGGSRRPYRDPGPGSVGVPRQRRPGGNMAVNAWSAGRTIWSSADPAEPAGAAGAPPRQTRGAVAWSVAASVAGPAAVGPPTGGRAGGGSGAAAAPRQPTRVRGAEVTSGRWWRPRPGWGVVPAWVRAVAIGAAAAALALAVLTAVSQSVPRGDTGLGGQPGGPDAPPGAPDVALQPGAATSRTGPTDQPGPGSTGGLSDRSQLGGEPGAVTGRPGTDGTSPGEPDPSRPAEHTQTASPSAPVLAAQLTTSGSSVLGGRTVSVTVSNPGPGAATGWVVAMNVGDQSVTDVSGAAYQRDGQEAIFTPLAAELPAGESTGFSFHLTAPVLGLLGGGDPTDCTVDGQPCDRPG
ncbi:MAG: hypothetical protein GEV12_20765 [Micromonosporaceae bacterium]|nr:hypothetical protein [Micromonosporaceae bacterium]